MQFIISWWSSRALRPLRSPSYSMTAECFVLTLLSGTHGVLRRIEAVAKFLPLSCRTAWHSSSVLFCFFRGSNFTHWGSHYLPAKIKWHSSKLFTHFKTLPHHPEFCQLSFLLKSNVNFLSFMARIIRQLCIDTFNVKWHIFFDAPSESQMTHVFHWEHEWLEPIVYLLG